MDLLGVQEQVVQQPDMQTILENVNVTLYSIESWDKTEPTVEYPEAQADQVD